jgi:hypothetical protein
MSQRDPHLVPCPTCHRHVVHDEAACPFCAAPLPVCACEPPRALPRGRLGRAALLAAGASATLIGACSGGAPAPPYGLPPIRDAGAMSDTADGPADGGGTGGRGGAGGASDGAGGTGTRPDAGGVVPLYGAPAPRDGG